MGVVRRLGPNMMTQSQARCDTCSGTGEICRSQDRCRACNGAKVYKKMHSLQVHVNKGTKNEKKYSFEKKVIKPLIQSQVTYMLRLNSYLISGSFVRVHTYFSKKS